MKKFKYIIVGGGIVAGYAAQEFIKHEQYKEGELAIITDDSSIPYERPPLSKDFLAGEEDSNDVQINEPEFYRENGIRLFLYTRANSINTTEKTIKTDHGDIFHYEKLLLATGSSPVELDVEIDSKKIKYLRTLDDAKAIRDAVDSSSEVTIVGGGYIGMETAASLAQDGHTITMVFPEDHLMERLFTQKLSNFFEDYYKEHSIKFIKGSTVEEFEQLPNQRICSSLSNGEKIESDLVVVGIGASPNLKIVEDSPIEVDDGVIVNHRLQTSVDNVYAAGDIANYYDSIFDKRRRVEHWQNAVDMAQYVAREMLDVEQDNFQTIRYFFSDIFDLSYEFWGDIEEANQVIHVGNFEEPSIGVWWLQPNRVVGALLMNRPDEEREKAQEWIRNKNTIIPETFEETIEVFSTI